MEGYLAQLKLCSVCKQEKDIVEFHTHSLGRYGVRGSCKLCRNNSTRNYYRLKGVKERKKLVKNQRDWHYRNRYGLTVDEVDEWKEQVNYTCQICSKIVAARSLHIDHCHSTGQVRDLICKSCNLALGCVNDDTIVLQKLIQYIEKWRETWLS